MWASLFCSAFLESNNVVDLGWISYLAILTLCMLLLLLLLFLLQLFVLLLLLLLLPLLLFTGCAAARKGRRRPQRRV